jgi:cytidine deaminase
MVADGVGLTAEDEALLEAAREVRAHAYAPYSKFHVGAAILTDKGRFTGVNVENAAYPLSVCAERNAIAAACAAGARRVDVVAVIADTEQPVAPCGGCRQVIHELGPEARIILASTRGAVRVTTIAELLPGAFGPRDLR